MSDLKIYITGDNTCLTHDFISHFGQSLVIEYNNNKYLFDTGEFEHVLSNNLNQFGISYDQIKDIIISHAHFDHVLALQNVVIRLSNQRIFLPEKLFSPELTEKQLKRYKVQLDLNKYNSYDGNMLLKGPYEIDKGFFITGPIQSDKIPEQSLVVDLKEKGIVIIVGCSHPKIQEIVDRAIEITGNSKVYGVIGGLHFMDDDENQLKEHIDYLDSLDLSFIVPMHCTGLSAMNALVNKFGYERVVMSEAGSIGAGNIITISPNLNLDFERRYKK